MLRPLGLALRSASANGCGGVIKAEIKSRSVGDVNPIGSGGHSFRQRMSGRLLRGVRSGGAIRGRSFPMAMTGTVKFFNGERGYGFIKPDDGGRDVFVHITAVERAGLKDLAEGQRITFEVEPDKKGKGPKAVNLVISS
jgi:CspA family cold shock protein